MGKGLGSSERNGLIILALVVVGIILAGFLLNRCGTADPKPESEPQITVIASDSTLQNEDYGKHPGSKSTRKRKSKGASKASKKSHGKPGYPTYDPFSDTIPVEY